MRSAVFGCLVLAFLAVGLAPAGADPADVGSWDPPFELGVSAMHATLLPNGKVLLYYKAASTGVLGSVARLWDPSTGVAADVTMPTRVGIWCSAQTLLPDGRVFTAGGHELGRSVEYGIRDTYLFDGVTRTWTRGPNLSQRRWYPSAVETADGNILTFAGLQEPAKFATTVDRFDTTGGQVTTLPASATKNVRDYPRMHLLPDGRLFMTGPIRQSYWFNPTTSTWTPGPTALMGRQGNMSVLLPGQERILVAGGYNTEGTTAHAETINLSAATPAWSATARLNKARRWAAPVQLPDGTVLAVGGGNTGFYGGAVKQAELFDPATNTWKLMASQQAPRSYHSTALLLPDGRVLSAGHDNGTYKTTGELYSPPYLFRGTRPNVTTVPGRIAYGQTFGVVTTQASDIRKVALVKLGSSSHAVNFDQRLVNPTFTAATGSLRITAPSSRAVAPPGWYMLFVLNSKGVPSVAKILQLR
jgi:hypothetical protein